MPTQAQELPLQAHVRLYHDGSERRTELLAFAELVIGGAFVIKDIRVLRTRGEGGEPFIGFPSRKGTGASADKFFEVAHPVTAEARQAAKEAVLRAWREAGR